MEIDTIYREGQEPRTISEWKQELLAKFLNYQVFSLQIREDKVVSALDRMEVQALKELSSEGTLTCHEDKYGLLTFFLSEEVSSWKKVMEFNYEFCISVAELYNNIMPTLIPDSSLFEPIKACEVGSDITEALVTLLSLTYGSTNSMQENVEDTSSLDSGEGNTFTIE